MKLSNTELQELIAELDRIRSSADELEEQYRPFLEQAHPKNRKAAANLVHYLALRSHDIRELQRRLGMLGVSRLEGIEGHVQASLLAVRAILRALSGKPARSRKAVVSIKKGEKQVKKNTTRLLGKKMKGAAIRIMVTMPTEAAADSEFVYQLVTAGMNAARINCAHDGPQVWAQMIENIGRARTKTGRNCRVAMDLGGPKIRTGALQPGPKVTRLRPDRDLLGRIVRYPKVWLGPSDPHAGLADGHSFLPVPQEWCQRLQVGSVISLRDARHKNCELTVSAMERDGAWAMCDTSAYVTTGTSLRIQDDGLTPDDGHAVVGSLTAVAEAIVVSEGDTLILTSDTQPGAPAELDAQGSLVKPAFISCTLPEVLSQVAVGDPISFDDGRIDGVVETVGDDQLTIRITYARGGAAKIRSDKGINLPRTSLAISGLTQKDKRDLEFVAQHADIVNFSFVNRPEDVDDLLSELERLGAEEIGIILKIETMGGFHRLPEILLRAMKCFPIGVMLARGDLAVEAGWKRLAQVQHEIMRICQAAHIPLVWATQVLETLAKKGMPSRAEITDLMMAESADCVMLNKGPHILETIRFLDEIMRSMEPYQEDKAPALPSLDLTEDWTKFSYTWPIPAKGKSTKKRQ
ncbi:MAG: hypothetical protein JSW71_12015 [Gemmatimonadota bacterium]|nr:MAG: hypothetical protein JSW71_12015 [Gemmatimonadota bacterium]